MTPATSPSTLLIAGEWRPGRATSEHRNPARPGDPPRILSAAGVSEAEDAVEAASRAARAWRRTPAATRMEALRAFADLLERDREELAASIVADIGKPIRDARAEVDRATAMARYLAHDALRAIGEVYPPAPGEAFLHTLRQPLGVVVVITPWNFPVLIPVWKLTSALAWGNTVVWKPAELASATARLVTALLVETGLPPGVLNLVTGSGSVLGAPLAEHPDVAAISFTGSTAVGRSIAAAAAPLGKKLQAELGGKNAALVLADADPGHAARCIVRAAMLSTGQRCTATSRAIVVDDRHDALLERVVAETERLRVGDPTEEATDLGPLASHDQFETVRGYLELARAESLDFACGGPPGDPSDGYYVQPVVLSDVGGDSRLAREEVFGPVLCVLGVPDEATAIELANDSEYGLSASIFTGDLGAAFRVADELETGVVHVNGESTGAEPHVPFGGMKSSSLHSRELGSAAREFFTDVKTVYTALPS
jgi:acyl-CoA reductase-like NAD-dependent aldehyde dehydrogenase